MSEFGHQKHPTTIGAAVDEQAFLRTILAYPGDDTPRLIYADWLAEKGDARSLEKAEFLRFICNPVPKINYQREFMKYQREMQRRAARFDDGWIAVVGKMRIENCTTRGNRLTLLMADRSYVAFRFVCDKKWEDLSASEADVRQRHCSDCKQDVYYGETPEEIRERAYSGQCVCISPAAMRATGDIDPPESMGFDVMGMPAFDGFFPNDSEIERAVKELDERNREEIPRDKRRS